MDYSMVAGALAQDADGVVFDVGSLYERLLTLQDGRKRRGVRYALALILMWTILAKLAGQDKPRGIAEWVRLRAELFVNVFQLKRPQMPHAVTYERVLGQAGLAAEVERRVADFLTAAPAVGQSVQISLDGKTLRGVVAPDQSRGLHLLAAYLPAEGIVLLQLTVDQKTNEISVAPELLKRLNLQGKIVTGDALHTQRAVSLQIVAAGGDYIWMAKSNQPSLQQDIQKLFQPESCLPGTSPVITDLRTAQTREKNRSRLETRSIVVSSLLAESSDWPHLRQVFKLTRTVIHLGEPEQPDPQVVYGLTSLSATQASPARLLHLIRQHWGIENGLHYRRDVTCQEDRLRAKRTAFGQLMACLNNLVIGLVRRAQQTNLAQARRRFDAHPDQALRLLLSRPT